MTREAAITTPAGADGPPRRRRGGTVAKIADELRQMIYAGVFDRGEKLVQERLAEQLGVSRVPLREAFVELASEGLVTLRSNRGAIVRGVSSDEIQQFQEMRTQLETFLLSRAIPITTADDLEEAETALAAAERSSAETWAETNLEFHRALYRPANRPYILAEVEKLYWNTFRRVHPLIVMARDRSRSDREHRALLDHVSAGKVREAVELLEGHILLNGQGVIDALRALEARQAEPS